MLVQMLYGIWTNSLGLISDGEPFIFLHDMNKIAEMNDSNSHGF